MKMVMKIRHSFFDSGAKNFGVEDSIKLSAISYSSLVQGSNILNLYSLKKSTSPFAIYF
jgi:hypothetical protein